MGIRPVNEGNPNVRPLYDGFRSADEHIRPANFGEPAASYSDDDAKPRLTKVKVATKAQR
jgi:hypothetical protein